MEKDDILELNKEFLVKDGDDGAEKKQLLDYAREALVFALLYGGLCLALQQGFSFFGNYSIVSIIVGLIVGVALLIFSSKCGKKGRIAIWTLEIVCIAACLLMMKQLSSTFSAISGEIVKKIFHVQKQIFLTETSMKDISLFAAIIISLFLAGLLILFVRYLQVLTIVIAIASWIAIGLGYVSSGVWLFLITAGAVVSFAFFVHASNLGYKSKVLIQKIAFFVAIGILITGISAFVSFGDGLPGIKKGIQNCINGFRYGFDVGILPEGDFTKEIKQKKDTTRLEVLMSEPSAMYLKGYTGSLYSNNVWKDFSYVELSKDEEMFGSFQSDGFCPANQIAQIAEILGHESKTGNLTVSNTGASRAYIYQPYDLSSLGNINTGSFSDNYSKASGLFGEKGYSFSFCPGLSFESYQILKQYVDAEGSASTKKYSLDESNYRHFVYEHYLTVGEEEKELLASVFGTPKKTVSSFEAKYLVRDFLSKTCGYSEEAEYLSEGSALKSFLRGEVCGSSVNYATAATILLRYLGIPARYVEGYVITPEMAKSSKDGKVLLSDSNAGAWTEYYEDGIGWVPFETNPDLIDVMPESKWEWYIQQNMGYSFSSSYFGEGIDVESYISLPLEYPVEKPQDDLLDQWPDQNKEEESFLKTVSKVLLWLLLIIVLLLLVIIIRRYVKIKKHNQLISSASENDKAAIIFADAMKIMWAGGLEKKNQPVSQMKNEIEAWFGENAELEFSEVCEINNKAMFSDKTLQSDETEKVIAFKNNSLNILKKKTGFFRKLKLKWLECLY